MDHFPGGAPTSRRSQVLKVDLMHGLSSLISCSLSDCRSRGLPGALEPAKVPNIPTRLRHVAPIHVRNPVRAFEREHFVWRSDSNNLATRGFCVTTHATCVEEMRLNWARRNGRATIERKSDGPSIRSWCRGR
jgi:hypothetical protein